MLEDSHVRFYAERVTIIYNPRIKPNAEEEKAPKNGSYGEDKGNLRA